MKKLLLVLILCLGATSAHAAVQGALAERFPNSIHGGGTAGADAMLWADPAQANFSEIRPNMRVQPDVADQYNGRLTAWLLPPVTGQYQFMIASDDQGRLWLSSDADPGNAVRIAYHDAWTGDQDWNEANLPTRVSAAVSLEAGKAYWIRAGHAEDGGGDNLSVAWRSADAGVGAWQVIPGQYLWAEFPFEVQWGGEKLVEYEIWDLVNTGVGSTSGLNAAPYLDNTRFPDLDFFLATEGAADRTGYLSMFTLSGVAMPDPADYFVTRHRGIIKVDEAMLLGLGTSSDDGSLLFVYDWWDEMATRPAMPVVDNGGLHGMQWRGGALDVAAGYVGIETWQYEHDGGEGLMAGMWSTGQPRKEFGPHNLLSRVEVTHVDPPNGAINVPTDQVLSWTPPFGMIDPEFRVYVWEQGASQGAGVETAETTLDPDLALGTAYWWQVDVKDPNEGGNPIWLPGKKWAFATESSDIFITSQPSDQMVDAGSEVTLAVVVESALTPFSYQWKKDGSDIGGAQDATLVIANFAKADNGTYTCEITNGEATVETTGALVVAKEVLAYWPLDADLDDHAEELDPIAAGDKDAVFMVNDPNTLDDDDPDLTVPFVAGKIGNAVEFDGATNFAYAGTWNPNAVSKELSVSLWAQWNGPKNPWQGLIGKRNWWGNDAMMWQIELNHGHDDLGTPGNMVKTFQSASGGGGANTVKLPDGGNNKVSYGGRVLYSNQHPTNADERAYRAFDGVYNTKWLAFQNTGWLTYIFPAERAYAVTSYAITSGNDGPERDPDDWTLQGSNDGVTWDILDTRTGAAGSWTARNQTVAFEIDNTTAYQMYKLDVTKIRDPGANIIQISEVELFADEPLDDLWVNIVSTYDGAVARTYINGWFVREAGMSFGPTTDANLVFGACEANPGGGPAEGSKPWGGNLFNGALDEIILYNYALSPTEILAAYMAIEGGQDYCLDGTQPALDFDGNCVVDMGDLEILVSEWMQNNLAE